ncbi:serine protease inhibitor dipetalogastin-like isoform X2 [Anticarsia gemmatalis]|uniref:serine protease inhibitor dipetalogastin-like isoform X2 n=1 Tax=Anticarsia gemmatalis TaxID=129554 RepID=UPI003F76EA11
MTFKLALLLIAAQICAISASTLERPRPPLRKCECENQYKPVCGSDGITYPSLCFLKCRAYKTQKLITIKNEGQCRNQQELNCNSCSLELKPRCGTDGKTYANLCVFNCHKKRNPSLQVAHLGGCKAKKTQQYTKTG